MRTIFIVLFVVLGATWSQAATGVVAQMWNMDQTSVNDFLTLYNCGTNTTQFIVSTKGPKCAQDICVLNAKCQRKRGAKTKHGATPVVEITATCGSNKCSDYSACLHDQSVTSVFGNAVVTEGSTSDKQPIWGGATE